MKVTIETASEIIKFHLGAAPKAVVELVGGTANYVYDAEVDGEHLIVRISEDAARLQFFIKEQWATAKAKELKVPVPEILEVGNEAVKFPYMIVKRIEGHKADYHPSRPEAIAEMGKYCAMINSIPTTSYGHNFDWSSNQLSKRETWKDYVEKELDLEHRLAVFEKHKILLPSEITKLKSALKELMDNNPKPFLCHSDMRLKNILLNDKGKISAILDWEMCTSNIVPYWDMAIALHDLTIDEKDIFLGGYGITGKEFRNRAQGMKALNIIGYAPFIEMAYAETKEEKRKLMLENLKNRLKGALDWYTL